MFLKLTQKKLILIVGIGTLIIVGGLIGVAWYYQMNREGVVIQTPQIQIVLQIQ